MGWEHSAWSSPCCWGGDKELRAIPSTVPKGRVAVSLPGSGAAAQGDGRDLLPGPRGCFSA